MLSLGLKNSILVLLIILILHFLIKNALLEKQTKEKARSQKSSSVVQEKFTEPAKASESPSSAPASASASAPSTKPPLQKDDVKKEEAVEHFSQKKSEEELFKFVFEDDGVGDEGDKGLEKYFKGMDVTAEIKAAIDKKMACNPVESQDPLFPTSTTCDPQLNPVSLDDLNKKVKAECDLPQNIPFMRLKEYENESSMNGGALYGDLSALDSFASQYEDYECGKDI